MIWYILGAFAGVIGLFSDSKIAFLICAVCAVMGAMRDERLYPRGFKFRVRQ